MKRVELTEIKSQKVSPKADLNRPWNKDTVATEEPLLIELAWTINKEVTVKNLLMTMRTPGFDRELITGLVWAERFVCIEDIDAITEVETNRWQIRLNENVKPDLTQMERLFTAVSSCGVCGKAQLQSTELKNPPLIGTDKTQIRSNQVLLLSNVAQQKQSGFIETGGMHASASFTPEGQLEALCEDVGRHKALDKLVGHQLQSKQLPGKGRILWVSGRTSFELVQKAIMAGFPIMVAVGAPSHLAINMAQRFGVTLIGFCRNQSFNIYTHAERIVHE